MNIAILGAGDVGSALAQSTVRAGHSVTVSSRDPEDARRVAEETGAKAADTNAAAVGEADIVVLALPADEVVPAATELGAVLAGKVVVDVSNRPTPDPERSESTSVAEELQASAPQARVVKALNTAFAPRQAEPEVAGMQADGYVAGDDDGAKQRVLDLVGSIGFRPLDVGPLASARTLEGMAWMHISLQMENKWPFQSAWKIVGPTG
jgi:predicted dinucleotide-binding enzyme